MFHSNPTPPGCLGGGGLKSLIYIKLSPACREGPAMKQTHTFIHTHRVPIQFNSGNSLCNTQDTRTFKKNVHWLSFRFPLIHNKDHLDLQHC